MTARFKYVEDAREAYDAVDKILKEQGVPHTLVNGKAVLVAAWKRLNAEGKPVHRNTFRSRYESAHTLINSGDIKTESYYPPPKQPSSPFVEHPTLPSEMPSLEEDIETLTKISDRKRHARRAKDWRTIRIRGGGPIAIACIGDPHTDNEGCNWSLLRRDVDLIKNTEGMFCGNLGDTVDNWVGRLIKYKGSTSVTDKRAWRLVRWLLDELDEKLVFWLLGNHDSWNDGAHIFEALGENRVIRMDDWQARFIVEFDNGLRIPIWAAHDFKGHSQYNKLHGHERADLWSRGAARLYISGHHHEWSITEEECPERKITYWKAKARGYKYVDSYAENLQFFPQDSGATITAVFNPDAKTEPQIMRLFPDIEEAAEFLTWKRKRWRDDI